MAAAAVSSGGQLRPSGAPPPAAIVYIIIVISSCFAMSPSMSSIDEVATLQHLTTSPYISSVALAWARVASALIIFGTQLFIYFGPGHLESIKYLPGSKLTACKIPIRRGRTLLFFTVWSWLLLGIHFTGTAFAGFLREATFSPLFLRTLLIVWELAAPNGKR